MKKTLLSVLLAGLLFGCQDDDSQPADANNDPMAVDFTSIDKSDFSGEPVDAGNFVINTQAEWDAFEAIANSIYSGEWEPLAGIEPELADYTYLVALDEWYGYGGHEIEIVSIENNETGLLVDVQNTDPADGAVTTVHSQPYHIVRIEKTTTPVTFE